MSSILETFFLLFETDANKALAEIKGLFGATKEADAGLVAAGDTGVVMGEKVAAGAKHASFEIKELDKAATYFNTHFIHQIVDMASGLLGFLAVEKLVDSAFELNEMEESLAHTAKALGVNVSELDAWDEAVKKSGGTAEGFQAGLKSLNEKLVTIAVGGPRVKQLELLFHAAGVNAKDAHHKIKSAIDILPELAARLSNLPTNQAQGLGMRLGLDQATIALLQTGQKNVEDLIAKEKALGVVTQQDADNSLKFEDAMLDTQQTLRGLFITVDEYVIPILTDLLDIFNDTVSFLDDHASLVKGFFIGIGVVAGGAAVYGVVKLIEAFRALTAAQIIEIAFNPFAWLVIAAGLLIAAIALVYDDFEAFKNHQKSIIGELVKKWPELITVFNTIKAVAIAVGESILNEFYQVAQIIEYIIQLVEGVAALPSKLLNKLGLGGTSAAAENLTPGHTGYRGRGIGGAGFIPAGIGTAPSLPAAQGILRSTQLPSMAPGLLPDGLAVPGYGGSSPTVVNVTVGNTTINTQASDPAAIAKVHSDLLSKQINQAIQHHADGVQS